MSSLVEQSRALFEDIERLELAIAADMKRKPKSHVGSVLQQHRIKDRLNKISELNEKLLKLIKDEDGSRKQEITSMSSGNVFSKFYDSLREIREYHKKFPVDYRTIQLEDDVDSIVRFSEPEFTTEECYGRYFDLHEHYFRWINLGKREELPADYIAYLRCVDRFDDIPQETKNPQYLEYLEKLWEYLKGFQRRAQPLLPTTTQFKKLEDDFDERWSKGQITGWQQQTNTDNNNTNNTAEPSEAIDLDKANSASDLEQFGLQALKSELERRGVKCGGSLQERAERLFSVKGLSPSQIPAKIRAPVRTTANDQQSKTQRRNRKMALLECFIALAFDLMREVLDATIQRTEKNQARTYEEIMAQTEEEMRMSSDDDDDDDDQDQNNDDEKPRHNPLNIPEGHDGQPIPYWLYKLHGLGIAYECEICGNYNYWGRRAFERHFQEWRHAHAMRTLKIPNTKHFHEITKIQDAFTLYNKLKLQMSQKVWKPDDFEEYEDTHGNIMNKKTFDDMRRQGLL